MRNDQFEPIRAKVSGVKDYIAGVLTEVGFTFILFGVAILVILGLNWLVR